MEKGLSRKHKGERNVNDRIKEANTTKAMTYRSINPNLSVHPIYLEKISPVKEHYRVATTRLRLSSHYLRIETGRWSRVPREQRMCNCGEDIQTECHAMLTCPLTNDLRLLYPHLIFASIPELMATKDIHKLTEFCFNVVQKYK